MNAEIVRLEQSSQGALGALRFDGVVFCFTLQPDANDPIKFCIPAGDYICKRFHGTKWPNTFEIIVEGHSALLFHAGNSEADSEGCVILGSSIGKLKGASRSLFNSGFTFKLFLEHTQNVDSFPLKIIDCYQEG
jgi:hypothetical protein